MAAPAVASSIDFLVREFARYPVEHGPFRCFHPPMGCLRRALDPETYLDAAEHVAREASDDATAGDTEEFERTGEGHRGGAEGR